MWFILTFCGFCLGLRLMCFAVGMLRRDMDPIELERIGRRNIHYIMVEVRRYHDRITVTHDVFLPIRLQTHRHKLAVFARE